MYAIASCLDRELPLYIQGGISINLSVEEEVHVQKGCSARLRISGIHIDISVPGWHLARIALDVGQFPPTQKPLYKLAKTQRDSLLFVLMLPTKQEGNKLW
jgi:hypothetical protein